MISAFEARELTKKAKEEDFIQHCDEVLFWVRQQIIDAASDGFDTLVLNIFHETYNDKIIFQVIYILNENGFEVKMDEENNCLHISWKEEK